KEVLARISPLGASGRIAQSQSTVLNTILDINRLNRLVDQRVTYGNNTLSVDELFNILTGHIFRKEAMKDICSRALQYDYIEHLGAILKSKNGVADIKAKVRMELMKIKKKYNPKKYHSANTIEAGHILELNRLIDKEIEK
ncbi:MAG: zinc-dependent metalloprotease, partial [Flavobacteriaceae bacterium]|nr:zinc-dependent metalloprotease [Flavobacteriaceae bacterium]